MRLRKGQLVSVEFLDHCSGGGDPIVCKIYGKITNIATRYIEVTSWEVIGQNKATALLNDEKFVIIRSTIKQILFLEEFKK